MTFIKLTNKIDAARAIINLWLQDQSLYCNHCDTDSKYFLINESCCDNPQIGRNIDHMRGCIRQNEVIRETNLNMHGANKDRTLRHGLSMPPRLLITLEKYFDDHDTKLFENQQDLYKFMKAFPALCTCKEV